MKFFELAIGDEFTIEGQKHIKVKEEKLTCCKIKLNAKKITEGGEEDAIVKPLQEVVKITKTETDSAE